MVIQFMLASADKLRQWTSPEIPELSDEHIARFLVWRNTRCLQSLAESLAEVSRDGDTLVVDLAEWPDDPQKLIRVMAKQLGVEIAPLSRWTHSVDPL